MGMVLYKPSARVIEIAVYLERRRGSVVMAQREQ
jgi:hypothetical protein